MKESKFTLVTDSGINGDYKKYLEEHLLKDKNVEYLDINNIDVNNLNITLISSISMVLITGGADVNPKNYRENTGSRTFTDKTRDLEFRKFKELLSYIPHYIPKLGICMGGQAFHVINGGKLIQHVDGHNQGSHLITIGNKDQRFSQITIEVPSDHHQMMYFDSKSKGELVAWSSIYNSYEYLDGNDKQIDVPFDFLEPEIIYYKSSNTLCVQTHPEYPTVKNSSKVHLTKTIKKYLNI